MLPYFTVCCAGTVVDDEKTPEPSQQEAPECIVVPVVLKMAIVDHEVTRLS